ncbi:MAG: hypothetical protein OSJ65_05500 [Bacilli bacterium]|nr:hypothetical protein [Bacilli bacterium]
MDYKKIFTENDLTNIAKFFTYMQNKFEYGWIDKDGNRHYGINDAQSYSLQSPNELLKSHIGICWDMAELSRCFFENMTSLKYETYYLLYDDNKGCPSHAILVFYDKNKVYWFEPMFNDKNCFYSGIHEYDNITKLLEDFKHTFIKSAVTNELIPIDYNPSNIQIYKYTVPKKHINGYEMRNHINNSEFINIK